MPSITFTTPGAIRWTCPANVTSLQIECWGAGPGGNGGGPNVGGKGGNGAEYAAEPAETVTPGVAYYGFIGQAGTGGAPGQAGAAGGNTTWNNGQVTAHGGTPTAVGSGSSNSVHHSGGAGGSGGLGSPADGGGGGGGSGAPGAAGSAGAGGTIAGGGGGGAAQFNGGGGGGGGAGLASGFNGGSPGGGGGGGGAGSTYGGRGGAGQIRLTWTSAPGAPASFPLPALPFFPAGYRPSQADLNSWFHDPFAFLETRVVARLRQAASAQALPFSGAATVLQFDTADEDPLGGFTPAAWSWGPPPGWSGWYEVTVTLATAALAAGGLIRPGITAPGYTGPVTGQAPGAGNKGGASGAMWVYLVGGQDTVQATGYLLNATANVSTDVTAGHQSSCEITWMAL